MDPRRTQEIELVAQRYGELEMGPNGEWVIIKKWALPSGWNMPETPVLVLVPSGYPVTPPDNFYTNTDLRPEGKVEPPGSASPNQSHLGRSWLQFSYHVEPGDWRPHADLLQGDNLMTFLVGVVRRLSEVN